jgi:membrane fusion protein (multidrug efflux system)
MKTKVIALIALSMLVACGSDKQAQLEKLKKQHDEISQKIEKLEKEIAASSDSTAKDNTGVFVSVEDIQFKPFNHYVEVQGKLDGDENLAIYPESMGVLTAVNVHVGDHVNAGQTLAHINDAAFQEQLKSLQTNYDLASATYKKQENLWNQHIGSEMQYLQAKATKESLESQIAAINKQIDMTRVKSPIDGNIEESMVKVGQAVSPSLPAFRVVNFSSLKVTADVAEAYTSKINIGDDVVVYFPDIKQEINAKITFCSKYINTTNRTFSVEAKLKTVTGNLKANMVAVVKINDYSTQKAIVLPINVIQSDNKGNYVLVAKQENNQFIARKQAMETGQQYNGLAEVTKGLEPGTKVITSGYMNLNDGQIIRF